MKRNNKNLKNFSNPPPGESRARSLVKYLVYRIFSIIGTGFLTWIIIGDINQALSITIAIQIFLAILYYAHERIWNKFDWGMNKNKESENVKRGTD